ncbi:MULTISPECIES: translation elongation factor 4 [Dehalobacter]|jgi:GTP-binding protein LepA|uniref:Elongation factor 4 n=2 Tax=Dehalobacter restrictus TaxID=55583 RepID=A0A857DFZ2_9FIRM|nr:MULTISPECIES: translation elongation factor 4 [Dehalobacter]AHF09197.1 GTP-binding protein LepA [Dehalobacter restrictus DSM 9455]MCG1025800.1 translation elongation factor 4 [Dehalobacter sp.]MDJ0306462.1 translation elongation factor 4 [Dehalobacter sp.]OCZ51299.1 elongation factor 4 [Dehalobacter sp. TeCB1]QGZ99732.1 elongation factor 4 [Dehalobacter restrictus]
MANASSKIRNFSIIAHIDHGKSTLADRLIEYTGTMSTRELKEQVLDSMDLERERGITIKLQAVRLRYKAKNGEVYELNLIDTPGHVDFSYEVSRSLAACEGALLVVDAAQGIEAQTLANVYLALENDLEIIPVINKIDLPSAEPDRVKQEIEDVIGIDASEAILASAKVGIGVEEILEAIVQRIPPPKGDDEEPLKSLIFDSKFDSYKGAIPYIRLFDGKVSKGTNIRMMSTGKMFEITEVGVFTPGMTIVDELRAGQVGYIAGSIKNVGDTRVGDTVTDNDHAAAEPLSGYRKAVSMVFCGLYPVETSDFDRLKDALEKLQLNDASLMYENETSAALGFGFRCGFLGLLHMEIIQERLEREFGLSIITTAPSVVYKVNTTAKEQVFIDNPALLPPEGKIESIEEPVVKATIMVPSEYVGTIMELNQEKRGTFLNMDYITASRVSLYYELPLSEIVYDYFDQLKSRTKGYASLDYELIGYKEADLVKLDIMLNAEIVDALSFIVHKDKAYSRGRKLVEKLRSLIPRQMFEIPVQAVIGAKVIARENIRAMRKDVLAKCYGGDISRKRKLLEKQKEGKKRMKQVGSVEIPQDAFMAVLKMDD